MQTTGKIFSAHGLVCLVLQTTAFIFLHIPAVTLQRAKPLRGNLRLRCFASLSARAHWPLCSTTCGCVFVAGIFIPVGNHYFQALASTLQFVAQVCDRLWLVPATDRAFAYITYMSPPHVALVCSGPPQCAATCGWTKWPVCSGLKWSVFSAMLYQLAGASSTYIERWFIWGEMYNIFVGDKCYKQISL